MRVNVVVRHVANERLKQRLIVKVEFRSYQHLSSMVVVATVFFVVIMPSTSMHYPTTTRFPFILGVWNP